MSHKISLADLRTTSSKRPIGYYEFVVAAGRVENDILFLENAVYAELRKKYSPKQPSARTQVKGLAVATGAGTELKKLIAKFGLKPKAGCKCNQHIHEMNQKGIEWCTQNIDTIVGWLREEATRANLPFSEIGAKILVKRAIRNALRAEAKHGKETVSK